jgi:hypothetical protein
MDLQTAVRLVGADTRGAVDPYMTDAEAVDAFEADMARVMA